MSTGRSCCYTWCSTHLHRAIIAFRDRLRFQILFQVSIEVILQESLQSLSITAESEVRFYSHHHTYRMRGENFQGWFKLLPPTKQMPPTSLRASVWGWLRRPQNKCKDALKSFDRRLDAHPIWSFRPSSTFKFLFSRRKVQLFPLPFNAS